jgi:miniconductance mechanosensitive channel
MVEAGARRIKRPVNIDIQSIKFCTSEMLENLKKIPYLKSYIDEHKDEQLTNIGLFRAYITAYLKNHQDIRSDFTFFVRHLDPTDKGLPIEIYVFTKHIEWAPYENIQADIFDHILAMVSAFELKVFQSTVVK